MKRFNSICLVLLFICTLNSCKKNDNKLTESEPKKSQFEKCDCYSNSIEAEPEYIKANIDGVPMCFDVIGSYDSNFPNMFKYGTIIRGSEKTYYDNTIFIRNAKNSPWQLAFFFENTHALTKTYPYNLPRPNPEVCEIGELQLNYNYKTLYSNSFYGDRIKMTVNSFKNNYFEGSFSGYLISKSSSKVVEITNGVFRIKLILENKDIVVK
jgi:hypothetical protein